jgi:serpin B
MRLAFEPRVADFSGMTVADGGGNPDLYLGDVLQKADVGMAEEGVHASAVTTVIVESSAASGSSTTPPTPIPMVVNRPYFFSILDVPTGAVLFMGHIVDPTQTGG